MQMTLYNLLTGPLAWASLIICVGGCLYRIVGMLLLAKRRDHMIYDYWSWKFAFRSIFHWILPFTNQSTRRRPYLAVVSFLFHLLTLGVPLFLFAHITLLNERFGIHWWYMPDTLADVLTVVVVACCAFFAARRLIQPDARYLSSPADFCVLAMVAAPFVFGFWAYHQWPGFEYATLLHMFSGELLLAAIPFTRLSHMIFFPITRGYMGSEFGGVRHAKDW